MKRPFRQSRLTFTALLSLALWLGGCAPSHAITKGRAKVQTVKGAVTYSDGKGGTGALTVGMILSEGATITTGSNAFAHVFLYENGQSLRVCEDSKLTLTQFEVIANSAANTTLTLEKGSIVAEVKKMSAISKYEVRTSKGVFGIRGTAFRVLGSPDSQPQVNVITGSVTFYFVVNSAPRAPVTVTAGQTMIAPATPCGPADVFPTPPEVQAELLKIVRSFPRPPKS